MVDHGARVRSAAAALSEKLEKCEISRTLCFFWLKSPPYVVDGASAHSPAAPAPPSWACGRWAVRASRALCERLRARGSSSYPLLLLPATGLRLTWRSEIGAEALGRPVEKARLQPDGLPRHVAEVRLGGAEGERSEFPAVR